MFVHSSAAAVQALISLKTKTLRQMQLRAGGARGNPFQAVVKPSAASQEPVRSRLTLIRAEDD
jgi:hypothetical protein